MAGQKSDFELFAKDNHRKNEIIQENKNIRKDNVNDGIKKLVANTIAEKLDSKGNNFSLSFIEKFNELLKSDE